jgi:hypothetical protein
MLYSVRPASRIRSIPLFAGSGTINPPGDELISLDESHQERTYDKFSAAIERLVSVKRNST